MPEKLENALRRQGHQKGYTGERLDRFIYGNPTMQKYLRSKKKKKK